LPIFTVAEAGPIWACWRTPDEEVAVGDTSPPEDCTFRWLHLDLWDRRNLRWIETATDMPPLVRDLFLGQDVHPRGVAERGWVGLVLPDFEREFDRTDNGRIGALRVGIGPNLVLTGRHHPLHTPDIIRHRAAWSSAIDGTIAAAGGCRGRAAPPAAPGSAPARSAHSSAKSRSRRVRPRFVEANQVAHPAEQRDIGDGVVVAHDPLAAKPVVEHAEQALALAIALQRALVLDLAAGEFVEEAELAEHRADRRHLEEHPLDGLVAARGSTA
jgi:hypothetical protein